MYAIRSYYDHRTNMAGGSASATFAYNFHRITIGTDYRFEKVLSNVLGEPLTDTLDVPNESGKKFTRGTDRNEFSVFAEEKILLNKWSLSAGVHFSSYNFV